MSLPRVFILEWNSMQATPLPRSTNEALEFFFTTPFDFLAAVTDQHRARGSSGLYVALARSKYARCEPAVEHVAYQAALPVSSNRSTFLEIGWPSCLIRSTVDATPAASHNSNGPISQLNPSRMARSICQIVSEISRTRLAE